MHSFRGFHYLRVGVAFTTWHNGVLQGTKQLHIWYYLQNYVASYVRAKIQYMNI